MSALVVVVVAVVIWEEEGLQLPMRGFKWSTEGSGMVRKKKVSSGIIFIHVVLFLGRPV